PTVLPEALPAALRQEPPTDQAKRSPQERGDTRRSAGRMRRRVGLALPAAAALVVLVVAVVQAGRLWLNRAPAWQVVTGNLPGAAALESPYGVAVDGLGNLYVVDEGNDVVQKLSAEGKPLARWGSRGTGPGQFAGPHGVAVDGLGNMYVADFGNN